MRYLQAWFLALALCLTSTAAPDLCADTIYYYMAKSDGSWSSVGIWYTNTTGGTDPAGYTTPASEAPDSGNSRGIIVNADVAFDDNVTIDQTTVNAGKTLTVNENILMTVADGSGPDLVVPGTLSIAGGASVDCQGSFDAIGGAVTFTGAGALYLSGDVVSLGTLTPGEGTVGFAGTTSQTLTGSNTFYDLVIDKDNATDTVDASGSTLVVTNGLTVTTGVFTSASALNNVIISPFGTLNLSGDITVRGDWQNLWGTFTHNNHTVTLNGADQYLFGSTTFYNLTKQVAAAATLEFEEGGTTTIENTLTLEGTAGQLLSLRSDWPEHQWNIDPRGTRNIAYLDVQDSNNINATAISAGQGSVNSLRNTNWVFYPRVTTQAVTGIGPTTATGNGNITDLGTPNPTAHGVCWNTTGNPTISDPHKDNGAASSTGAFTAAISGLTEGVTYYVRAFATNDAGAAYGDPLSFKSKAALTMAVSPAGGGTTTPAAGSTTNVDAGMAQNITASAATGRHFVNWTASPAGNAAFGNASSASTTVTLTGSATVTANFTLNTYTLTGTAGEGGSIHPPSRIVTHGNTTTFTVTPNTGYSIASVTGCGGSLSGNTYTTGSIAGACTVSAAFSLNTYTLTTVANPAAGGTVIRSPDKTNYDHGENVQVTATASAGYGFTGWAGDLSGTTNPASLTMDGNKTVTANFVLIQALASGKSSSFSTGVTKVEMFNGTVWVTLFSGSAQLDLVAGGTFPGIGDLELPPGTYSKIRVTFENTFPTSGSLSYGGTAYYTTGTTFGGQTNLASVPTTVQASMAAYTFRIAGWGALNADVVKEFNITPISVTDETDYQPTIRFTLGNRLRLMGVAGSPGTYYFEHTEPGVSVVE